MKKVNVIAVILMIIAIINIGCIIRLFFDIDNIKYSPTVMVLVMQIISFVISITMIKKAIKNSLKKIFIVIAILILTFFIPVSTKSEYLHGEISSFFPIEVEKNIYNITI